MHAVNPGRRGAVFVIHELKGSVSTILVRAKELRLQSSPPEAIEGGGA
jgi:hypothetical protein